MLRRRLRSNKPGSTVDEEAPVPVNVDECVKPRWEKHEKRLEKLVKAAANRIVQMLPPGYRGKIYLVVDGVSNEDLCRSKRDRPPPRVTAIGKPGGRCKYSSPLTCRRRAPPRVHHFRRWSPT
mmetsp:Transcript_42860/g.108218  ORF Transcript_42860/g.108218 Transcript_42860/m.108218 type:complete len:123 (+) Transcript_42860:290-658(+)